MKLGFKTIDFMETRTLEKLTTIEKETIEIENIGSYVDKYGDKKVVFTTKDNSEKYFYMPDGFVKLFNDEMIEKINNNKETVKGYFEKIDLDNGRKCWNFTDM